MRCLAAFAMALPLLAQVPAQDSRNTELPNTDTHFRMREYKTLDEWKARREHLRRQVLSAAGLLPLPVRTPLNPQVFGRIAASQAEARGAGLVGTPTVYFNGRKVDLPRAPSEIADALRFTLEDEEEWSRHNGWTRD